MGWSPQFSFRLRDDQVAFGDLIIDKNGAQFLAEMLLEIKNGAVPDLGLMKSVLDDYCYTDDEFASLREEMAQIQEDIKEFKSIGSNTLQKWNVFMQTIAVHTNYAIGSDTWIERYKELKMIAANMFDGILKCGYKFGDERLKQLHERYDEIIGCTNGMERVGNYLQKQYKEAVLNGDENALDNYCNSMVETGVWTQEIADRERKKHELNDLLNAAEGKKEYANSLKEKQKSKSAITITWDMWKTMCDRVDDCDPDSVAIEDIQKAEGILDYICTIYASQAGINLDDMKVAHRSSQLINVGIATVNTTKYRIEKDDYEFIMGLKTRSEAIREKANNGYVQITQDLVKSMISSINTASGGGDTSSYLEANGILADVYNEINRECDVVDLANNTSECKDFMKLMAMAIDRDSTGPLLDSACIMYPNAKIDKFFMLCKNNAAFSVGTSRADSMGYNSNSVNVNLSMEESMLLEQTSGNIDTETIRSMIENGKFVLNKGTLKIVYERIANWLGTERECSTELVTALYNITNQFITNQRSWANLSPELTDAANRLRESMSSGGDNYTSVTIMNDIIDMLIREEDTVTTDIRVDYWNTVIKETYIRKDGFVECMDFRILLQAMAEHWTSNYTWCVNMQKALFSYLTTIDRYVSNANKFTVNEILAMVGDFLKEEVTSFDQDQRILSSIVSSIETMNEVRHIKIAIDPDVYKSIYCYMNSGKTSMMQSAMRFVEDNLGIAVAEGKEVINPNFSTDGDIIFDNDSITIINILLWQYRGTIVYSTVNIISEILSEYIMDRYKEYEPFGKNTNYISSIYNYMKDLPDTNSIEDNNKIFDIFKNVSDVLRDSPECTVAGYTIGKDAWTKFIQKFRSSYYEPGSAVIGNLDITAAKTKEVVNPNYHVDEDEMVSINQYDILNFGARVPSMVGLDYKNAIVSSLIMYLKGIQNWAPADACETANRYISIMQELLKTQDNIYPKETITEYTKAISEIQGISAIEVDIPKALHDFIWSFIITEPAKDLLKRLIVEYSNISLEVSDIISGGNRDKNHLIYEDYIYAIVEMDPTEIPVDSIGSVGTLMDDIVYGIENAWKSAGFENEWLGMGNYLGAIKSNLSPMLFENAWGSAKDIAKLIISHMNIYPDVYTDNETFFAVFQEA